MNTDSFGITAAAATATIAMESCAIVGLFAFAFALQSALLSAFSVLDRRTSYLEPFEGYEPQPSRD